MGKINDFIRIVFSTYFCCCFMVYSPGSWGTDCVAPVQPIKQGQPAQCDGYLFSPSEEEIAYKATQIGSLQKEEISILQARLDNYKSEANDLSKQLASKTSNDQIWRAVYFIAGVGITALAVRTIRP